MFFFFNDTATTEIYTLSLHDALPISGLPTVCVHQVVASMFGSVPPAAVVAPGFASPPSSDHCGRSEEHTSELQSQSNLVCRLLLEKKKNTLNASRAETATRDLANDTR